ncbi:ParB/RepB/Spo0J family partition protein [Candidatus Pacearchaeota archaeon]|nr:ParB/RepB/Spo0J family partition protein [Candidatus Pacearchaeota archaeon]
MPFEYEILEIKKVPLKDLVWGKGQVRKHHVSKDINELADSIRIVGQLQPIVVCQSPDQSNKFEILTGQRRFLACKELGRDDILAVILDRQIPEVEAQIISFTENLVRRNPDDADYIDLCNHLYKIYADVKIIAEKTGLPVSKVRGFIKYASLTPELKEQVDKGKGGGGIDLNMAVRIQTALEKTGEVKPEIAVAIVDKMKGLIPAQRDRVVKEIQTTGVSNVGEIEEITEAVKKGKTYVKFSVSLDQEVNRALSRYALEEGMKREDAAQSLITEALGEKGLLEENEE